MANAPFMYWVGMTTAPDLSPEDEASFNAFYSDVHVPEVVASNPGFLRGTRYQLLERDLPNGHGPRYLAVYETEDEASARHYIRRSDGPPEDRPAYTRRVGGGRTTGENRWRLMWRRLTPREGDIGSGGAPYLMLIGMDLPAGTEWYSLKQFHDFYNTVHAPQVARNGRWRRASRYELFREFEHPEPGAPRFLAAYEGDEDTYAARLARKADPSTALPSSPGPPIWQARTTMWRLLYRRISSSGRDETRFRAPASAA